MEEEAAAEAEDSEKENVVKKELVEEQPEGEDVEALKAKVRKLEENNKCSKCTVSYAPSFPVNHRA